MRVTLDTNVLISATFWKGDSDRIIELAEHGKIELILSPAIIEEFLKVLDYKEIQEKIVGKNLRMRRPIEKIISIAAIVIPKRLIDIVKEDPADNKIFECAIEGKAGFVVSQDKHLLRISEYGGVKVVSPRELLGLLEKNSPG